MKCKIEGCNKKHKAKGFCDSHYQNFRLTGNPIPQKKVVGYSGIGEKCSVPGCEHPIFVVSLGLCKTHYHRLHRTGSLEISRNPPDTHRICSVEGCTRAHKAKGLCGTHYGYLKRYGSATPDLKQVGGQVKENLAPVIGKDGYVYVWDRARQKVLLQHRVIMELHIGRKLLRCENVHHINGKRNDNRLENLELWNTMQPAGQRVEDKIKWAKELLMLYEPESLKGTS